MPDNPMNTLKAVGIITMMIGAWLVLLGFLGLIIGGMLLAIFGFLIYLFAARANNTK